MINQEVADNLLEIARLLEEQGANPFRVNAYRNAASVISRLPQPVSEIVARKNFRGLVELPGIGEGIARSIYEYVAMGRMSRLESLQGGRDPVALFESIPGIGPKLAHNIIEFLHIDSLEALEAAAHNHRLQKVPGFSDKKVAMVEAWLAQVLGGRRLRRRTGEPFAEPPVEVILQLDRQYRDRAEAGELPTIAPRRFNPEGQSWLPVMHVSKGEWHYTLLYSNSKRAHDLGRSRDWVVVYFYDEQHHEGQNTVVSETHGAFIGQRMVRGREAECHDYYTAGERRGRHA